MQCGTFAGVRVTFPSMARAPAKSTTIVHWRAPEQLTAQLDALIEPERGLANRSQVLRMIVEAGLGNDILLAAVREAAMTASNAKRRIVGRIAAEFNDVYGNIVSEELERLVNEGGDVRIEE